MVDTTESDSSAGFKRRIAEIQNDDHCQETPSLQQQEGQRPSPSSIATVTVTSPDSKDSSDTFDSSSRQKDLGILDAGSGCFKKVRSSYENDKPDCTEEKIELPSACGKDDSGDFVSEISGFECKSVEETDNCTARDVEEKAYKADVEMESAIEEGGGKENLATSSVVADESKEVASEALLEAKKKLLLAELEVGRIFEDKTQGDTMDGLKVIDGNARSSLKIEVIDDTALIESVRVPKTGNGRVKEKAAERNWTKEEKKREVDGKKAKRSKRKAKDPKKDFGVSGRLKNVTHVVKDHDDCIKKRGRGKLMYSRGEIEALRFDNIVEQKKIWREIYSKLEPVIMAEYDGLASATNGVNFDPRQRFSKKPEGPEILGVVAGRGRGNHFGEECYGNVDNEFKCTEDSVVGKVRLLDSSHSTKGEDCSSVVEAECSEDYDSDEEYSIQKPAFMVEGEPDFDSGPPEDGWEYLRRVRWEASHIPKVKVAKHDRSKISNEQTAYMPQIPDIAPCPEHLLPLKEWEDSFLTDFSELRQVLSSLEDSRAQLASKLQSIPAVHDESKVLTNVIVEKFNNLTTDDAQSCDNFDFDCSVDQTPILNTVDNETAPSSETSSSEVDGNRPTLTQILRMDSVTRVSTLRKRVAAVETLSNLSRNDCLWLFALCGAVDTPLDADTSASLRSLLRKCASLRALKTELDDEVVMLNILATVCGRYFGQSEK